jgi:hypothetical protein
MPMSRRLSLAVLLAATLASATTATIATAATAATSATLPSHLMLPDADLATHGVVERWTLTIKLESNDLKAIDPCRQVLAARGYAPVLSKMASSARPELHFKIEGRKEYAQASADADDTLAAVQQAQCKGALNWTVVSRQVPR